MAVNLFNNGDKKPSTNSYGFGWSDQKAMKRLSISMWDNLCQIQINDLEASDGGYPKTVRDSGIKLSAAQSTISSLLSVVEEILDELKTGATTFESDSVFFGTGGNNAIQITDGSEIGKEPGLYIVLYKNVDENQDSRENGNLSQFNTGKASIKGYKPGEKASGKIHKRYRQELKEFKVALEEYERAATNMQAHFNRVANNLNVTKSLALLSAIAATNGISAGEALGGGGSDSFSNSAPAAGADNFKFSHGDYSDAYN